MALAPDGQMLASRCKDGAIYLWDLAKPSGHLGYRTLPGRLKQGSRFGQFTSDSRSIAGVERNGDVVMWDVDSLRTVNRWPGIAKSKGAGLSPDAKWIVTTDFRDQLSIRDVATGSERTLLNFKTGLRDWEFSHDGVTLITVSGPPQQARLETWDTRSWQRVGSIPLSFETLLDYTVNFEPKSFTIPNTYVVMADGAFHLFDVHTLKGAQTVFKTDFESNDWAGSPDGRMLAAADSSGIVWLWEVATLRPLGALKSFLLGAHSVSFSSNGRRLVAGSNGREAVKLWDVETWQEVLTLRGEGSRFVGVKFSPDGRHLLAVNDGGVAHVWTAPTWEEIAAEEAKNTPAPSSGGNTDKAEAIRPDLKNSKPPVAIKSGSTSR